MTREEAKIFMLQLNTDKRLNPSEHEAVRVSIKALEQEPCEDAISREEMLQTIDRRIGKTVRMRESIEKDSKVKKYIDGLFDAYSIIKKDISKIPSVTPAEKVGRWIPVSERLPEDEQEVLFSTKTGRVHGGKYHDDDSANQWYSHRDKCRAWNNVVNAWMPLPAPYKPQERETWNGIHAQITAPKGTFERIVNDTDDDDDI